MTALNTKPTTDAELLACLRELPRLHKPHWSWPFDGRLLDNPELLAQTVRILGAAALPGAVSQQSPAGWQRRCAQAVAAMKQAGVHDVVLNYGCWGGSWLGSDPRLAMRGEAGRLELQRIEQDLRQACDWLVVEAAKQAWQVNVVALWLDQETFQVQPGDVSWNEGVKWVNDQTLDRVRRVLGTACHVVQHARGLSPYYSVDDARTGSHSIELYNLEEPYAMAWRYQQACARAHQEAVSAVYPMLSLGGSYWADWHYSLGWRPLDYRPRHAWLWGSWLNHPYWQARAPIAAELKSFAHRVLFWPRVLPANVTVKRGTQTAAEPVPESGAHFVAYCCGAADIRPEWVAQ